MHIVMAMVVMVRHRSGAGCGELVSLSQPPKKSFMDTFALYEEAHVEPFATELWRTVVLVNVKMIHITFNPYEISYHRLRKRGFW